MKRRDDFDEETLVEIELEEPETAAPEAGEPAAGESAEGLSADERRELEELRREVVELRDRSVRALADLDNYRKRSERERRERERYALAEPLRSFLDVVDNLERALSAEGSLDDLKMGVEMILRQMRDLLSRHGATAVPAEGQPFDPAVHEAVAREEDPEVEFPVVRQELQRGYRLHDRLLRPARVTVAMPVEGE